MKKLLLLFCALLCLGGSRAWADNVTYHMIYNGEDVATYEMDKASATLAIPRALYAAYCTYNSNFYGSASGDDVLSEVADDIYIRCTGYTGPVTFSSSVAGATYYMLEPGQGYAENATNFMYAGTTNTEYGSGTSSVISNFTINENAQYAFIGTPFSFKVYCKSGYYLACTSTVSNTRLTVTSDQASAADYVLYKNGHKNAKDYTNIVLGYRSNCYGAVGSKGSGTMLTVANTQNAHQSGTYIRYWTGDGADFSADGIVGGLGYAWFYPIPFVTATYQVVDENKANLVNGSAQVPSGVNALDQLFPKSFRRGLCSYSFYNNSACTVPVTNLTSAATVYVTYTCTAPFDFSTEVSPKYYLIYSNEQLGDDNYFLYKNASDGLAQLQQNNRVPLYTNDNYQWAFIGNPYSLKLKNKAGGYLAAQKTTDEAVSTAVTISSKITSADDEDYTYQTFSLYKYTNGSDVTDKATAFALTLNGSNDKTWIDGAKNGRVLYHSGIAIDASLGVHNWRTLDLLVVDASKLNIELNSDGTHTYATMYLPFDVEISSANAYTLTVSGSWAIPTQVPSNQVPAGTPVLLKGDAASATATINTGDAYNGGKPYSCALTGTYTDLDVSSFNDEAYFLGVVDSEIGFYHWAGTTLKANRAYIEAGKVAGVKGFAINFDDIVDGINTVQGSGLKVQDSEIYNIAGQRMNSLQRGVNIVNGKKVILK